MANEKEIRFSEISGYQIERREEEGKMIIDGYAAVFDKETFIGYDEWGFYETIDRKAFDGANMKDVPLKYNHDDSVPILARTRNKSLSLSVDETGLIIHAELLDTTDGIDMYKRIKAELIDKMSFAFTIAENGDEIRKEDGKIHRRINKINRLYDVSVVDTPAYEDTSVFARSRDRVDARLKALDGEKVETLSAEVKNIIRLQGGKV